MTILQNSGPLADGFIFIGPQDVGAPNPDQGPEIIDNEGRPVWFLPTPGDMATDFRVQTYMGNPVLTWSQGITYSDPTPGDTTDYIMDATYTVIAKVQAGNGYNADIHDFQLTPQNTALVVIYHNLTADLSPIGGPVAGAVTEGVVQEVDIATGAVLFEWHSLPGVPVSQSYLPYSPSAPGSYDYFHINSVKVDTDGNLLISSRHTWTVYKVNRTTGAIIWRLGGKSSDFALGPGLPFSWQHDAEAVDAQTLRIFDNESDNYPVLPYSRVLWVTHDDAAMTASIAQELVYPGGLSVTAEGNAQSLSNGDTFVEWGIAGRFSEFDPSGQLLWNGVEAPLYASYRGYRFPWTASPATPPAAAAFQRADGAIDVHAVWNGATQVAGWQVLGAGTGGAMSLVASVPWNGLDTVVTVPGTVGVIEVVAVDASGATIATSAPESGPFPDEFSSQPVSQTIAAGSSIVLSAPSPVEAAAYQWFFNGTPVSNGAAGGATISGATGATLVIRGATAANAGSYACVVASFGNSATSEAASVAVASTSEPGHLVNLSCRADVGTGVNHLIAGFGVDGQGGAASEPLLIRASGPALAQFGLGGVLADPELTLVGPDGIVATDDDWGGSAGIASAASSVGAFAWPDASSADAALLVSLPGGTYTAQVTGAGGGTGEALAEVYDDTQRGADLLASPRLINLSARAQASTASSPLIAGFVIGGTTSVSVLIRGSGPALSAFGIAGALSDPRIELYQSNGDGTSTLLLTDTGWRGDAQIAATAASVGAFSWGASATPDSALLVTLPPGSYTAQVSGAGGDSGVALAEVYLVP